MDSIDRRSVLVVTCVLVIWWVFEDTLRSRLQIREDIRRVQQLHEQRVSLARDKERNWFIKGFFPKAHPFPFTSLSRPQKSCDPAFYAVVYDWVARCVQEWVADAVPAADSVLARAQRTLELQKSDECSPDAMQRLRTVWRDLVECAYAAYTAPERVDTAFIPFVALLTGYVAFVNLDSWIRRESGEEDARAMALQIDPATAQVQVVQTPNMIWLLDDSNNRSLSEWTTHLVQQVYERWVVEDYAAAVAKLALETEEDIAKQRLADAEEAARQAEKRAAQELRDQEMDRWLTETVETMNTLEEKEMSKEPEPVPKSKVFARGLRNEFVRVLDKWTDKIPSALRRPTVSRPLENVNVLTLWMAMAQATYEVGQWSKRYPGQLTPVSSWIVLLVYGAHWVTYHMVGLRERVELLRFYRLPQRTSAYDFHLRVQADGRLDAEYSHRYALHNVWKGGAKESVRTVRGWLENLTFAALYPTQPQVWWEQSALADRERQTNRPLEFPYAAEHEERWLREALLALSPLPEPQAPSNLLSTQFDACKQAVQLVQSFRDNWREVVLGNRSALVSPDLDKYFDQDLNVTLVATASEAAVRDCVTHLRALLLQTWTLKRAFSTRPFPFGALCVVLVWVTRRYLKYQPERVYRKYGSSALETVPFLTCTGECTTVSLASPLKVESWTSIVYNSLARRIDPTAYDLNQDMVEDRQKTQFTLTELLVSLEYTFGLLVRQHQQTKSVRLFMWHP
jgi:hypothetical protein